MVRRVHEMRTITYHCDACRRGQEAPDETYPKDWVKIRAEAQAVDGASLLGSADVCPMCVRTKTMLEIQFKWRAITRGGQFSSEQADTTKLPAYAEYSTKERAKP